MAVDSAYCGFYGTHYVCIVYCGLCTDILLIRNKTFLQARLRIWRLDFHDKGYHVHFGQLFAVAICDCAIFYLPIFYLLFVIIICYLWLCYFLFAFCYYKLLFVIVLFVIFSSLLLLFSIELFLKLVTSMIVLLCYLLHKSFQLHFCQATTMFFGEAAYSFLIRKIGASKILWILDNIANFFIWF